METIKFAKALDKKLLKMSKKDQSEALIATASVDKFSNPRLTKAIVNINVDELNLEHINNLIHNNAYILNVYLRLMCSKIVDQLVEIKSELMLDKYRGFIIIYNGLDQIVVSYNRNSEYYLIIDLNKYLEVLQKPSTGYSILSFIEHTALIGLGCYFIYHILPSND